MAPAGAQQHDAPIYNRSFIKPSHAHVNPLMRAWAALPTLHIAGLRAIVRVNTRNSGFTCEQRTTARHWCAQNADHFATSSPLSAFFTEVVCNVGVTPPRTAATPPPIGGIAPCKGATRRRHAASQLLMLQKPHHRHGGHREQGSPAAVPVSSAWAPP